MLDQTDDQEIDELEPEVSEPEAVAEPEAETPEGQEQPEAEEEGEVVVSFGDEQPEEQPTEAAPAWVKELRKQNRELKAKVKELETVSAPKPQAAKPKPTLESCDYDAARFETELLAWKDAETSVKRAEQEANQAWESRLKTYSEQKKSLRVADFDDAEEAVQEVLSVTQQAIILQAADDPAKLVYALGRNAAKAKELSGEKDPVKFAAKVAKMEMQLKVTPRKPAVTPERKPSGSGSTPTVLQNRLDKLRQEAEGSGDWTKYFAEKRKAKG